MILLRLVVAAAHLCSLSDAVTLKWPAVAGIGVKRGGASSSNLSPKSPKSKSPVAPVSVLQTLIAGGGARSISQFVTYPMDALRTISQTRKGAKKLSELGAGVLVSGCFSTSMFAFPLGAVQFTVFGNAKKALTFIVGDAARNGGIAGTAVAITSSACASLASCAVGVPQEILKQRLVNKFPLPQIFPCIFRIFR